MLLNVYFSFTLIAVVFGHAIPTYVKTNSPSALIFDYEPVDHHHHHQQPYYFYHGPPSSSSSLPDIHHQQATTINSNSNSRQVTSANENSVDEVEDFLLEKLLSALQEYLNHRKAFRSGSKKNQSQSSISLNNNRNNNNNNGHNPQLQHPQQHHHHHQHQQQRNRTSHVRKDNKQPTSYSLGSPIQSPDEEEEISFEQP